DAGARARAAPRRLRRERRAARLRPLPVHRGRGRRGRAVGAPVALHRRRRRTDRRGGAEGGAAREGRRARVRARVCGARRVIRARTGLVPAASSVAATFLGRAALDRGNGGLVVLRLVAFALSVAASLSVLLPKNNLVFAVSGTTLYEELCPFRDD